MFYLGIDIGKFNSVATLIDEKGTIIDKTLKFSNSIDGANSLLELIDSYVFESTNLAIAMESTGHYWLSIFSFLSERNFNICIINPIQIKSFRKSFTIRKVKNEGKPILLTKVAVEYGQDFEKAFWEEILDFSKEAVDGIMLETFLIEEEVFDAIEKTGNILSDIETKLNDKIVNLYSLINKIIK